jgi:probable HAF family extracellular repeat protein
VPGDSHAYAISINNAQQVVGVSCVLTCDNYSVERAFLWENGDMVDLNALVQPPSDLVVAYPEQIDDRGYIEAQAVLSDGDTHAVVLIPRGDWFATVRACPCSRLNTRNGLFPLTD